MTNQDGGDKPMGQSLEQFAAECRRILKDTPGPDGREKVRALVERDPQGRRFRRQARRR